MNPRMVKWTCWAVVFEAGNTVASGFQSPRKVTSNSGRDTAKGIYADNMARFLFWCAAGCAGGCTASAAGTMGKYPNGVVCVACLRRGVPTLSFRAFVWFVSSIIILLSPHIADGPHLLIL